MKRWVYGADSEHQEDVPVRGSLRMVADPVLYPAPYSCGAVPEVSGGPVGDPVGPIGAGRPRLAEGQGHTRVSHIPGSPHRIRVRKKRNWNAAGEIAAAAFSGRPVRMWFVSDHQIHRVPYADFVSYDAAARYCRRAVESLRKSLGDSGAEGVDSGREPAGMNAPDISDTYCRSECCLVLGRACTTGYECLHHKRDFDAARARAGKEA